MEKFKAARPDTEILYGKYVNTKSKFHVKHLVYGWCNTSVKERRELCTKYINNVQRIPVKVSKNGKTIGEYKSLSLCVKELAKIGFKTTIGTIQKKIKTNNGLYNGLLFEYL